MQKTKSTMTDKSKAVNENIKCEYINQSNQNSEIVRMDKKQDATI